MLYAMDLVFVTNGRLFQTLLNPTDKQRDIVWPSDGIFGLRPI